MSASWNVDDLARMLALEHAFDSLAFISAANYARLEEITPVEAVTLFRTAIEGSVLDGGMDADLRKRMRRHLKTRFDNVMAMAGNLPTQGG